MRGKTAGGRTLLCSAAAAVLGLVGLAAQPARAGYAAVHSSIHLSEADQAAILAQTFGGSFTQSGTGGRDLTNGVVTATRLDDDSASLWQGHDVSVSILGRFAGSDQTFGYLDGKSGGTFHPLLVAGTFGYSPSAITTGDMDMNGTTWRWARDGDDGRLFSSLAADNGGADQLITYQITGGKQNGLSTYLLFWEDVSDTTSDRDFNDLVVLIQSAGTNGGRPTGVPLPPAAWTGLATLAGGGLLARGRAAWRWIVG